jgi:hypothetical protein
MEEAGEIRGGRLGEGVILTRRGTAQAPLPPPTTPLLPVHAT